MRMSDEKPRPDTGDDKVVLRAYAMWAPDVPAVTTATVEDRRALAHVFNDCGAWTLALSLNRGAPPRKQMHFLGVDPTLKDGTRWPLVKLAPGVWDLPTSIHVDGQFHGFVTLLQVPNPAPWESVIPVATKEGSL